MPQFQLSNFLPVTMASLSLPARKKGADVIHTTDIAFDFEGPNTLLDLFDPELLPMIYRAAESDSEIEQQSLEGVEQVSSLPMLRSTAIKMPMLLALEYAGYTMVIDRGLGETAGSNIKVDEMLVKRIRVWCKEGGSIKGSMHVQSRNVSDAQVGQLRAFLKLQTQLKLLAPVIKQSTMGDADAKAHFKEHLASGAVIDGTTAAFEKDTKAATAGSVLDTELQSGATKSRPRPKAADRAVPPAKKTAKPKPDPTGAFLGQHGAAGAGKH